MPMELVISTASLLVSLTAFILTIKINTIQASSSALLQMMDMRKHQLLSEVRFLSSSESEEQLSPEEIIEILSYLNLVCKLYLNSAINNNILRTFEGVIIKIFNEDEVIKEYEKIYSDFKTNLSSGEPPYINLIYTRNIIINANKIVKKDSFLAYQRMLIFMSWLRFKFNILPNNSDLWKLSSKLIQNRRN